MTNDLWDKISHLTELRAQGYEFVVLPDPFLIHYPHPYSEEYHNLLKQIMGYNYCNNYL